MDFDPDEREEVISVIEQSLEAAVVLAGVVKVRPATSGELALDLIDALTEAGFAITRK